MIRKYVDFELSVFYHGQQLMIDINGRPYAINLPSPLELPSTFDLSPLKSLFSSPTQDIARLGNRLYDFLFVKEVDSRFQAYLNRRTQEEGVRVCVSTSPGVLSDATWEILCSQITPSLNFLALDPKTPIVRSPKIGKEVYLRDMGVPLSILVVLSTPRLVEKIDRDKEKTMLDQALGKAVAEGRMTVDYLGFDEPEEANFDRLQEYLEGQDTPYDIVHLIGHGLLESGQEGTIALVESGDGKRQDVSASSLANLFRSRGVMLVLLQSCQSGAADPSALYFSNTAQQLVVAGVPAVLAMQETIDQDVARYFIEKLYSRWLYSRCPFEDALTQARQAVYQKFPERLFSWVIPTLFICPGVQLLLSKSNGSKEIRERLIDAALPQHTRIGKQTELVVLIRTPTTRGLREILNQPQDFEVTPEDVKTSPSFDVLFPVDEFTGKILPKGISIVIESSDFDLPRTEERVQLRPQGDSVLCIFPLTPKQKGTARLLVSIVDTADKPVTLTQLRLRTEVRGGKPFETRYRVASSVQKERGRFEEVLSPDRQDIQSNRSSGENVHTSGGAYIRGNVTNQGGVNQFGGTMGDVTYTDNRGLSPADEAHLKELFASLHQQIDAASNATPEVKADAKEAAQALQEEVDAVKQDPHHKPDHWKMNRLIAAFKSVGSPVLNVAFTILGFPPLGTSINAFAVALPDNE